MEPDTIFGPGGLEEKMFTQKVQKVPIPPIAMAGYRFTPVDYADAFQLLLPGSEPKQMRWLAQHLFARRESFPGFVVALLYLRDILVKPFGLKGGSDLQWTRRSGEWIGFFEVLHSTENEIILGDDDRHLDFRVSLLRQVEKEGQQLTLCTFVRFHNLLGRLYFALIKPFHQVIVAAMLQRSFAGKNKE